LTGAPGSGPPHRNLETDMQPIEQIEMDRYRAELDDDVRHLVRKYSRIMGWDVPELDEAAARALIMQALRDAVAKVEAAK
jgi:hypothetical protein